MCIFLCVDIQGLANVLFSNLRIAHLHGLLVVVGVYMALGLGTGFLSAVYRHIDHVIHA